MTALRACARPTAQRTLMPAACQRDTSGVWGKQQLGMRARQARPVGIRRAHRREASAAVPADAAQSGRCENSAAVVLA